MYQQKRLNEVERLFRRVDGFRRMPTRYDTLDVMFIGVIPFALISNGLRLCQHALAWLRRMPELTQRALTKTGEIQ
jgi:hypothetical protein